MAVTGVTFLLSVDQGGAVYNTLAGQRSTTLNRSTDEADATDKDNPSWHIGLATIRNWSFDAEGVLAESDVAWVDLEDAWLANATISVRITQPDATTWTGDATVATLNADGPHDDILSYSVSLRSAGALTRA
jgi:TP901-1 family phage major tail protein